MTQSFDHVVVGAGHNGLVCAALLAKSGRRVLVLEAQPQIGGMVITREFAPGFKVSACAHLLHAFPLDVSEELDLERHGLHFAAENLPTYALNLGGPPIVLGASEVSGIDLADTRAYADFRVRMGKFARVLGYVFRTQPFRLNWSTWRERMDGLRIGLKIRMLGKADMREFLRIAGMNAYDLLTDNFESTLLKGVLGFDAVLGAEHGARSPGTVLTLLYRWAGQAGTGKAGTAQPTGGLGAVTQAIARSAAARGVEIRTGTRVQRIRVADDRVTGVVLESGEVIETMSVVSNADPKTTFLKLLGPEFLDTDFVRRIDHFRCKGVVAKLHLALHGLPSFIGVDGRGHGSRMIVSPSLDYLELAFNPSKYRKIPDNPVLEIIIPTVNDPSLAPAGNHVMSINVMFVPYDLGPDPDAARGALTGNVLAILERYAPGIKDLIVASELLTPSDIEREFGSIGGHWHHGALALDQFFFTRPVPGAAGYTTPVPGLLLCGAGSHPGGNVMGLAGRNAARKLLEKGH